MDAEIRVREGTLRDMARTLAVRAETFEFHRQGAAPQYFRSTDAPPPTRNVIADLLENGKWEFNQNAIALYERLGYRTFSRNMWREL